MSQEGAEDGYKLFAKNVWSVLKDIAGIALVDVDLAPFHSLAGRLYFFTSDLLHFVLGPAVYL